MVATWTENIAREKMEGGLNNTAREGRRREGDRRGYTYTVKAMSARRVTIPHFRAMGHSSGLSTSPRGSKSKSWSPGDAVAGVVVASASVSV